MGNNKIYRKSIKDYNFNSWLRIVLLGETRPSI